MNGQHFPVFWKDIRVLRVHVLGALLMQGLLAAIPTVMNFLYKDAVPNSAQGFIFPKIQIAITALIALTAAAQWYAEERVGRNELLLKRLAASKSRIWTEKMMAGLAIILTAILLQCIWILVANQSGARYWPDTSWPSIVKYLTVPTVFAYLVGLPLSLVMRRGFEVILCGMGIVFGAIILWSMVGQNQSRVVFALLLINGVLACAIARGFVPKRRSLFNLMRVSKATALLKKEANERRIVTNIAAALILLSLAKPLFGIDYSFTKPWAAWVVAGLWTAAILCTAALGATCYSENERSGTRCMLFHHPANRHYVFGWKVGYGLLWLFLLVGTYCTLEFVFNHNFGMRMFVNKNWKVPFIYTTFLFGHFALIFACSVMLSRISSSVWFGILAGVGYALLVYCIGGMLFYFEIAPKMNYLYRWDDNTGYRVIYICSKALWLGVFAIALAAWHIVTDKRFEVLGGWAKALYLGRLTVAIVLWSPIVALTGWGDLFYLLTNWG